jgi:transmembrane sensor
MSADSHLQSNREEQAYAWAVRLHDARFADWDAFDDWIAADPANLEAYNAAVDGDASLPEMLAASASAFEAANDDLPRPRARYWLAGGGAVAAALALAVTLGLPSLSGGKLETIATGPGETREIALANGDKVVLNGDSRLVIDRAAPRQAVLEQGQALFSIRHDEAHPFEVKAGNTRLLDAGTVFDVVRHDGTTRVAVSEGLVIYEPQGDAIRLEPGKALSIRDAGKPVVTQVPANAVGGWKRGTLIYLDASVSTVASDLSRSLGAQVRLGAAPGKYSLFTGTLSINGEPGKVLPRLAPLLGVSLHQDGKAWVLSPTKR